MSDRTEELLDQLVALQEANLAEARAIRALLERAEAIEGTHRLLEHRRAWGYPHARLDSGRNDRPDLRVVR